MAPSHALGPRMLACFNILSKLKRLICLTFTKLEIAYSSAVVSQFVPSSIYYFSNPLTFEVFARKGVDTHSMDASMFRFVLMQIRADARTEPEIKYALGVTM